MDKGVGRNGNLSEGNLPKNNNVCQTSITTIIIIIIIIVNNLRLGVMTEEHR